MKLKHFLWRCLQNGLPANEAIYKRIGKGSNLCCGEDTETIEHIFFFCPKAQVVWRIALVRWKGITELQYNMWRWWDAVTQSAMKEQGMDRIKLKVNMLWQIWTARNKMTFQTENVDAKLIVDKAQQEWIEYEAENETDTRTNASSEVDRQIQQGWEPPKEGVIKINTDATISAKMVTTSLGIIARN
ncbi:uncharacterized protein [Coffea arabica]|uniref:Reverse transcriptase zinc-binding domain-containing protein n=1 Tax=Coffea arabica TaxID=13443 RepID=A0A6P6S7Z7_COFAR|nr:uncharacterized protein LOC113688386 [Coffea arabica]